MASLARLQTGSSVNRFRRMAELAPGIGLCLAVAGAALVLEMGERRVAGKAWLEALILAILIGTAVRSLWRPGDKWHDGIAFCTKYLLEVAVVLLGASISAATIMAAGLPLLAGIALVVAVAILMSFGLGRLLGLPTRMALLIACGNAICGNSAIVAVAPVIGADSDDVAASIAFTAVLGVVVVLGLPLFGLGLGMSGLAFGTLAGLTVYAVPQVIAAAAPLGPAAVHMGMLVKLVRVLMLGPVCLILSLVTPRLAPQVTPPSGLAAGTRTVRRFEVAHLVPWFIIGFLMLVACRSFGLVPNEAIPWISRIATLLTVVSMAGLGLGVDVRTITKAGARVTITVVLSLLGLGAISLTLLTVLKVA